MFDSRECMTREGVIKQVTEVVRNNGKKVEPGQLKKLLGWGDEEVCSKIGELFDLSGDVKFV